MDTANPYQVHDSTVKLVILTLDRDQGRLPSSVATDHVRKWSDSTTGKMKVKQKYFCVHNPYRGRASPRGRDKLVAERHTQLIMSPLALVRGPDTRSERPLVDGWGTVPRS
jgi:hypothetical protein